MHTQSFGAFENQMMLENMNICHLGHHRFRVGSLYPIFRSNEYFGLLSAHRNVDPHH